MKKKKSDKAKFYFFECLVDVLIFLGLLFLFFPFLKDPLISYKIKTISIMPLTTHLPSIFPNEERISPLSIKDIFMSKPKELKTYGIISIPSIDWAQPIYVGMTNSNLFYGGVAMYPKRNLDKENFVVFGHHVGLEEVLFGKILKAKKDDQVILTYLDQTKIYRIKDTFLVDEKETSIVSQTEDTELTLFTCPTPQITSQRYVIKAVPIEVKSHLLDTKVEYQKMVTTYQKMIDQPTNWIVYLYLLTTVLSITVVRFIFVKSQI